MMNVVPRRSRSFHPHHHGPVHGEPAQPAEIQSPNRTGKATILAVDTDPVQLTDLCRVLVSQGYTCYACTVPGDALAVAAEAAIEVFICAMELAGESSIALYERVLEARGQYVPAIFLSSAQSADIIRRQFGTRGTYSLRRPWNAEVLVWLLESLRAPEPLAR